MTAKELIDLLKTRDLDNEILIGDLLLNLYLVKDITWIPWRINDSGPESWIIIVDMDNEPDFPL